MLRALFLSAAIALPALVSLPDPVSAEVRVTYVAPETFRDREFRQERSRASALAEFDKEFDRLAARYLPAGQDLAIEVYDIDLAGDFEPWNFDFRDVRILRDTTPPRIRFRYTLSQAGQVLRQDDIRLSDMNYLSRPGASTNTERFSHDKGQIADWFRKTFTARPAIRTNDRSSS